MICWCVHEYVYVLMYVYICMCTHTHVYVCIWVYVHMCMYVLFKGHIVTIYSEVHSYTGEVVGVTAPKLAGIRDLKTSKELVLVWIPF